MFGCKYRARHERGFVTLVPEEFIIYLQILCVCMKESFIKGLDAWLHLHCWRNVERQRTTAVGAKWN